MNNEIRAQFPALQRVHQGKSMVFLDGPAGSQVPEMVIEAIAQYYRTSNANSHGHFITTQETDQMIETCREKLATFLGAPGGHCISLGANMTSLNFSLAQAIVKGLQTGDEILITQLDHEANRGPWLSLRDWGIIVREVALLPNGQLDYVDFAQKINENTRLVALGMASNIFGTVNDVAKVRELSHQVGAWLLLDAVHYAPHFPIDVQQLDCDFLLCSAYKFYGPHVGILYTREGLLDRLQPHRLRTADQMAPYSIETGTQNHAALAGTSAAIDFMAHLGEGSHLREQLEDAFTKIEAHEKALALQLYQGLQELALTEVIGPDYTSGPRSPTLSFTYKGKTPAEICHLLGQKNICAWDGHFYALRAIEVLGLLPRGGVTRMGVSLYTTKEEVDFTLEVLGSLA
ncbi:MAG: cysteine desulfurase-like protein [Bacteroidota bacterium]